jgi:hypothetical protein
MFATLFLLLVAMTGSAQTISLTNAPAIRAFGDEAAKQFGEPGTKAAEFLVAGMPDADRHSLTKEFLIENLRLAFSARESFPREKGSLQISRMRCWRRTAGGAGCSNSRNARRLLI